VRIVGSRSAGKKKPATYPEVLHWVLGDESVHHTRHQNDHHAVRVDVGFATERHRVQRIQPTVDHVPERVTGSPAPSCTLV